MGVGSQLADLVAQGQLDGAEDLVVGQVGQGVGPAAGGAFEKGPEAGQEGLEAGFATLCGRVRAGILWTGQSCGPAALSCPQEATAAAAAAVVVRVPSRWRSRGPRIRGSPRPQPVQLPHRTLSRPAPARPQLRCHAPCLSLGRERLPIRPHDGPSVSSRTRACSCRHNSGSRRSVRRNPSPSARWPGTRSAGSAGSPGGAG
jgi:hypothetical protein